jgi:hypothetical protein
MPLSREEQDTEPTAPASGAPATPRASGEQRVGVAAAANASDTPTPQSSTRAAQNEELAVVSEPSDTLLSAGKPADRLELLLEDRLAVVDQRLREVDERLHEVDSRLLVLEQKKSIAAPEPRQKSWLWIAFLIAIVVVFQLLRRVR